MDRVTNRDTAIIITAKMTMRATSMTEVLVHSSSRKGRKSTLARKAAADNVVDAAALSRLLAWMSPAYPIGAFSYSAGIEWAVEAGDIADAETLREWLPGRMRVCGGRSVASFCC